MGILKQRLQDAIKTTKSEGGRLDDNTDPRQQKKVARQMYLKRKLDKEIKKYIKDANPIKYTEIERIQRSYGI